jgi:hypothetical protein
MHGVRELALIPVAIVLAGCLYDPFPVCEEPQPTCYRYETCPGSGRVSACVGEPFPARCFDEDFDGQWTCHPGIEASGCPTEPVCDQEIRDSGIRP